MMENMGGSCFRVLRFIAASAIRRFFVVVKTGAGPGFKWRCCLWSHQLCHQGSQELLVQCAGGNERQVDLCQAHARRVRCRGSDGCWANCPVGKSCMGCIGLSRGHGNVMEIGYGRGCWSCKTLQYVVRASRCYDRLSQEDRMGDSIPVSFAHRRWDHNLS